MCRVLDRVGARPPPPPKLDEFDIETYPPGETGRLVSSGKRESFSGGETEMAPLVREFRPQRMFREMTGIESETIKKNQRKKMGRVFDDHSEKAMYTRLSHNISGETRQSKSIGEQLWNFITQR